MGDRTSACISIGGVLRGEEAVRRLVEAVEADAAGENYGPTESGYIEDMIRDAVAAGRPVCFSATEVNYGELEAIEAVCDELGLERIARWESGGDYSAGVRRRSGASNGQGGFGEWEFSATNDGEPTATLWEIRQFADNIGGLIYNMGRCTSATLPPLTIEE